MDSSDNNTHISADQDATLRDALDPSQQTAQAMATGNAATEGSARRAFTASPIVCVRRMVDQQNPTSLESYDSVMQQDLWRHSGIEPTFQEPVEPRVSGIRPLLRNLYIPGGAESTPEMLFLPDLREIRRPHMMAVFGIRPSDAGDPMGGAAGQNSRECRSFDQWSTCGSQFEGPDLTYL